jgi:tetratricopeptide (TPR) repeat protein
MIHFAGYRAAAAGRFILVAALLFLSLLSCREEYAHFLVGSLEENREMHTLFDLLEQERDVGENRFIIIQQIANRLHGAEELDKLILFLTGYVENNQNDPYNAYYLGIVAAAYRDRGAAPMAVHYYERILKNYPDLLISGTTVHYQCLQELLTLVEDPGAQIEYYKELISRFSKYVDPGATYFYLAEAYEQVGEWEQAINGSRPFVLIRNLSSIRKPRFPVFPEPTPRSGRRSSFTIPTRNGRWKISISWSRRSNDPSRPAAPGVC